MTTAKLWDLTEEEYHSDPIDPKIPSFTSSTAKTIESDTPMHAWTFHPRLGGLKKEASPAMVKGKAFHALLAKDESEIEIIDASGYQSKVAKEARDNALFVGLTPILQPKYDEYIVGVEVIRKRIEDSGRSFEGARVEQSVSWNEYLDDKPILCRARLDYVWFEDGRITDLKSAATARPRTCASKMLDLGYAIQEAAYRNAVEALMPDLIGKVTMDFIFFEVAPPYAICAGQNDGAMQEIGAGRWYRGLKTWQECLRTGVWPGFRTDERFSPPGWALSEEMMEDDE